MRYSATMPVPAALLLGPTGAGKTPFGEHVEAHGFNGRRAHHFDFGEQLRAVGSGNSVSGSASSGSALSDEQLARVRDVLERGALLEDSDEGIVRALLGGFIAERGLSSGGEEILLLNGLPRHAGQAAQIASAVSVRWVVVLDCDAATVRARIASDAGGDRGGRQDDDAALVEQKLETFRARTQPLVEHYADTGAAIVPVAVSVETQPADVQRAVEGALQQGLSAASAAAATDEPYRFEPPFDERAMLEYYNRWGFCVVSGLIPAETLEQAVEAMWAALEEGDGADRQPIDREDRSTWPRGVVAPQLFDPAIKGLWTPEYIRIGRMLSDGYEIEPGTPGRDHADIKPPMGDRGLMAINTFPIAPEGGEEREAAEPWQMPGSHLDHCIPDDGYLTFPRPVRMSTMTYLTDCAAGEPAEHGGSTVVWPGSSRKFERLAATDPERFRMMIDLGNAREEAGVGVEGAEPPVELRHRAGDVLFCEFSTSAAFCHHALTAGLCQTTSSRRTLAVGTPPRRRVLPSM